MPTQAHLKRNRRGLGSFLDISHNRSDRSGYRLLKMASYNDSKIVDIKGFEAEPQGDVFERAATSSEEDLSSPVQAKPKRKWQSYIWDTLDKSPEERRLLFKLDAAVLTYATCGYFIKYLDQININNAFVSGMKEDLGLYKNQLNYMQTCWTVGYVIGEVPCESLEHAVKR